MVRSEKTATMPVEKFRSRGNECGSCASCGNGRLVRPFPVKDFTLCSAVDSTPLSMLGFFHRRTLNGLKRLELVVDLDLVALASRLVALANPTTAISSASMESVIPCLRAAAVWDAMQ